ncbi:sensor histidine kinase [Nocardioides panaciterrulae]|uniref:histidine kinase n=1 Tax=Nocardioides panaciterrulae TaxID=661492 RepID=A0A7Y9E9S3_9ACTN|nr:ATP-binding protein [Nocardioides panaciterrulae]NYD43834.1 K+-sensing histidine kinase KdpD [Nocardioides panaciterrulae]
MSERPQRDGSVRHHRAPPGDTSGEASGEAAIGEAAIGETSTGETSTGGPLPRGHGDEPALSGRRRLVGWVLALVLPLLLTAGLRGLATGRLPLAVLLFLAAAVLAALEGGMLPALASAILGFLLLNWYFTPPVGRWNIAEPTDLVTLLVYVAVASGVATVVHRASRGAAEAARARAEAATLASLSHSVLTGQDTAQVVVTRLRAAFDQESATLLGRTGGDWRPLASAGPAVGRPEDADTRVPVDPDHVLVLRGPALRPGDQRVLEAFAVQAGLVMEYRRLRESESRAAALERAEATSTALLRGVSHDLRTPLATIRAALDGLAAPAVGDADRGVLIETLGAAVERLQALIDNLLDLSRLQTGLLHPVLRPVSLEEVLPPAVADQPPGSVVLELDESTPLVLTDPGLLERVVANLVTNAVRFADGTPVRVGTRVQPDEITVQVTDRGPGVPPEDRDRMFEPFQRLDDGAPGGLGLGLAVARGLAGAVGGNLRVEDTPGGGLTMLLDVPRHRPAPPGEPQTEVR